MIITYAYNSITCSLTGNIILVHELYNDSD